jgi:hypothetical protein
VFSSHTARKIEPALFHEEIGDISNKLIGGARETMINAYAARERPRGWSFLAYHWELIIVSLGLVKSQCIRSGFGLAYLSGTVALF